MSSPIGAAPDPDWDHEGREWAGKEQEQLLTTRVSHWTIRPHSLNLWPLRLFLIVFFFYLLFQTVPVGQHSRFQVSSVSFLNDGQQLRPLRQCSCAAAASKRTDGCAPGRAVQGELPARLLLPCLLVVFMQSSYKDWEHLRVHCRSVPWDCGWHLNIDSLCKKHQHWLQLSNQTWTWELLIHVSRFDTFDQEFGKFLLVVWLHKN